MGRPAHETARAGPASPACLLGVPAAALAGELLSLDEVAPGLAHLPGRPAERRDPGRWRAIVVEALLAHRREEPGPRAEVGEALARLTRGVRVEAVAAGLLAAPPRHAGARRVRPRAQQLHRIGRFERSRALVGRRPLAEVAARCGYADHAHLTREWVALAGCPPTTWLREEFPFLHDVGTAEAAR